MEFRAVRRRENEREGAGNLEEVEGRGKRGTWALWETGDGEAYRSWISSIFWSMRGRGLVSFRLAG